MSWHVVIEHSRPWEVMELVVRRHWIVYVIVWLNFLAWLFASIGVLVMFSFQAWVNLLIVAFWMFFSLFLFIEWLNHELDLFVVTNNRIIWIDQISFLNRKVSECNLWQVQDVWSLTKWFFANILNYWTISIQTAWNAANFIMEFAPEPIETSRKIHNIVDHYRDSHSTWKVKTDWSVGEMIKWKVE